MALEEFRALNIDFVSHQEGLDTSTPTGKAIFTIIASMAQLEQTVTSERLIAGLDNARMNGTRTGKPVGRPRVIFRKDDVVRLREEGASWSQIAKRTGISSGSARRAYLAADHDARSANLSFAKQTECEVQGPIGRVSGHETD